MSSIFGGAKQSSVSNTHNEAFPQLQQTYTPQTQTGVGANGLLAGLLGVPGGDKAGAQNGLDAYKNSSGYNFTLDSGSRAITGNAAAKGLLSSGATAQGLSNFGQQTAQTYYNNYLSQLLGLSQQGTTAGNLIAGAGGVSNSTSSGSSKPGIAGFLGSLASALPKG